MWIWLVYTSHVNQVRACVMTSHHIRNLGLDLSTRIKLQASRSRFSLALHAMAFILGNGGVSTHQTTLIPRLFFGLLIIGSKYYLSFSDAKICTFGGKIARSECGINMLSLLSSLQHICEPFALTFYFTCSSLDRSLSVWRIKMRQRCFGRHECVSIWSL